MKCNNCGLDIESNIGKCTRCEEPLGEKIDYAQVQDTVDYWADDLGTLNVENHPETMGELERIRNEITALIEIYEGGQEP